MRRLLLASLALVLTSGCLGFGVELETWAYDPRTAATASGALFPDLVVEVDHERGYAPSPAVLAELKDSLQRLTDKREIRILGPSEFAPVSPLGRRWDPEELHRVVDAQYDSAVPGATANGDEGIIHVVYLGGEAPSPALGQSIGNVAVVFIDSIRSPLRANVYAAFAETYERHVLLHEVGHTLGLVDNGVPDLRGREVDNGHSPNPQSVMYQGFESPRVLNGTADFERSHWFDEDDVADLRSFQSGLAQQLARDPQGADALRRAALGT